MVDAALASGEANTPCVFEVFTRRLPIGRRFGVFAGTGRLLELIGQAVFSDAELAWLVEENVVSEDTAGWLKGHSFGGSIEAYAEGEVFFPGSPVLTVRGTFAECILLETLVLSVLNHDSAVASAAARMVLAADGTPLIEMGSRRTHEASAVAAARASYLAGFSATSNLAAGHTFGVPTAGTTAHAFTLLFDAEAEAFSAQVSRHGTDTTLLVDTYDTRAGVTRALEAAGADLGGVRIDSGDLSQQAHDVRAQLDTGGATNARIVATGDLDERRIAELSSAPVDVLGVGTSVVTGGGHPTAGLVFKLSARQTDDGAWLPVAKYSPDKATVGGRKYAGRMLDGGVARIEEVVIADIEPDWANGVRPLVTSVMADGAIAPGVVGPDGLAAARDRCAASLAELSDADRSLAHGIPSCATKVRTSPTGALRDLFC